MLYQNEILYYWFNYEYCELSLEVSDVTCVNLKRSLVVTELM